MMNDYKGLRGAKFAGESANVARANLHWHYDKNVIVTMQSLHGMQKLHSNIQLR